jgi:hypothetical protein
VEHGLGEFEAGKTVAPYTMWYLNQVFVNFYKYTFDYQGGVIPGLPATIKYWYEV